MELIFEVIMCVLFDAAMLVLVLRLCNSDKSKIKDCRLISGTFALGFLFGIVEKCLTHGSFTATVLLVLGFVLACIAFALTFSEKRKDNESR